MGAGGGGWGAVVGLGRCRLGALWVGLWEGWGAGSAAGAAGAARVRAGRPTRLAGSAAGPDPCPTTCPAQPQPLPFAEQASVPEVAEPSPMKPKPKPQGLAAAVAAGMSAAAAPETRAVRRAGGLAGCEAAEARVAACPRAALQVLAASPPCKLRHLRHPPTPSCPPALSPRAGRVRRDAQGRAAAGGAGPRVQDVRARAGVRARVRRGVAAGGAGACRGGCCGRRQCGGTGPHPITVAGHPPTHPPQPLTLPTRPLPGTTPATQPPRS